jgi:hypothetical protein
MMDRRIDWQGLPAVMALLGVEDEELFLVELFAVKDFVERMQNAGNR